MHTFTPRSVKNWSYGPHASPCSFQMFIYAKVKQCERKHGTIKWKNICLHQECSWNQLIICEIMQYNAQQKMKHDGILRNHEVAFNAVDALKCSKSTAIQLMLPRHSSPVKQQQNCCRKWRRPTGVTARYCHLLPPHVSRMSP